MFGGIKITVSDNLPPDFYEVTYPNNMPWRWPGGNYNKRQLRRYGRKLRASAKPICLSAYMIAGGIVVTSEMLKEIERNCATKPVGFPIVKMTGLSGRLK